MIVTKSDGITEVTLSKKPAARVQITPRGIEIQNAEFVIEISDAEARMIVQEIKNKDMPRALKLIA